MNSFLWITGSTRPPVNLTLGCDVVSLMISAVPCGTLM